MYGVELQARDYMALKCVDTFWIDSAWGIIRQGLASNQFIAQHIIEQSVTVVRGRVKRYAAKVRVRYPDTCTNGIIGLRYTCNHNPNAAKAHKLWLGVVEG